ncbi:unnamed protein product [Caenorhabditis auriculariae]|uniref:Uncharacterized protein n=1 Tax=Caenorhabditis auriculariae TaxID=2777116 RepID=A0A8S1H9K0_9PELO|nr:unnamed protein product [Caenorhabditis auriculariae]
MSMSSRELDLDFVSKLRERIRERKDKNRAYDFFPRPGAQFCIHVSLRSVQTAALIGSVLGPVSAYLFRHQKNEDSSLIDAFIRGGMHGAMVGAVLGPMVTLGTVRNMHTINKYKNYMKIRSDQSQLWQDHITIASAAVGWLGHGNLGLVVGLDLSLLFALLTRNL